MRSLKYWEMVTTPDAAATMGARPGALAEPVMITLPVSNEEVAGGTMTVTWNLTVAGLMNGMV